MRRTAQALQSKAHTKKEGSGGGFKPIKQRSRPMSVADFPPFPTDFPSLPPLGAGPKKQAAVDEDREAHDMIRAAEALTMKAKAAKKKNKGRKATRSFPSPGKVMNLPPGVRVAQPIIEGTVAPVRNFSFFPFLSFSFFSSLFSL